MNLPRRDLVKGTLDLLILAALSRESMHGWGITQQIKETSQDVLLVNQGSLYPALARLGQKGLITDEWRVTENSRRARYYSLTAAGKRRLAEEREHWEQSYEAVNLVLAWSEETS